MKKLYVLLSLLFLSTTINAQNPDAFVMTFKVTGTTPQNLGITVPIVQDSTNNYTIDFGDGTILTNQTGNASHTYNTAGTYTVSLTGTFGHIRFYDLSNGIFKLRTVEQWGTNQWTSMEKAFMGCSNLIINATDAPDLSQVTNMTSMFNSATSFNQSINHWDVSNVTNMSWMFRYATSFNQPLNDWDVSNVTDMSYMFMSAHSFNQPLNNWDVSNVTDMSYMFKSAYSFNGALNDWDVSSVTEMSLMFEGANSFNQPLNDWDVLNVVNMGNMFSHANSFNQPLNNWNVSNVTSMGGMFWGASSFNQPLNNWDVSSVMYMTGMFMDATSFNQSLNDWDVLNVMTMKEMFVNATSFNQPLNNWDVSSVTSMTAMFENATSFNQPLSNWDVSSVNAMFGMERMFRNANSFNQSLNSWVVSSVTSMVEMFKGATSFNQPLNNWDVSNVTNINSMFEDATSFNHPLNNWDLSNVTYMTSTFKNATSFNQDLSEWNFKNNVYLNGFLTNSGLSTPYYDLLLARFVDLVLKDRVLGALGLKYCNTDARNHLVTTLNWTISGDSLSGNCGDNHIVGIVIYDEENNGCDENDMQLHGILIKASDGDASSSTFSANGGYTLNVYEGTHTINLLNLPNYFLYSPENEVISFEGTGNIETLNFCLTPNQTTQDLNITILPITEARPGFKAKYQLIVQNIGTQTVNNVLVTLTFDDTMQSFVSASLTENPATTNQLNFEIASLSPFSSSVIDFTMQTFTPPTVNGDDILNFTATVTPNTDDYTPNDNAFELAQIVVNSYDPNDKLVLQGSEIYIDDVNEYLHYMVRFQNTGTASAINVRIEDTLHESLDWNTIQILNSSHNYRVEITDGNQMEFIFNNINLPYEAQDEEGSNGFIAYKIKPIAGTQIGDFIIGNEAYIYFDFNEPIITNTTSTEVVEETSSVSVHNLNDLISVYPNPTNGVLHISSKGNTILEEVKIYNLQGRELFNSVQNLETIHIEDLSSGVYLMNIKTNQGTISKRVIKK